MQKSYKASTPGSLILMGEYAVLLGHPAIVAAINKRIVVTVTTRADNKISIISELGQLEVEREKISVEAPFEFVLTALIQQKVSRGYTIEIESEFSSKMGLGSSAAVTVALIAALAEAESQPLDPDAIYTAALETIRTVQGKGSGADVAASVYGGVLEYCPNPLTLRSLPFLPEISVVFSGEKTTTAEALLRLTNRDDERDIPLYLDRLGGLSREAVKALEIEDWDRLGFLMNQAQKELVDFGVSTDKINQIIAKLRQQPTILGAKISGSGLGDCVVALGTVNADIEALEIHLSKIGLTYAD